MNQYSPGTQFSAFPPGVKALLIINGLVFFATTNIFTGGWTGLGEALSRYIVLYPIGSGLFYPWQLVTYMFLHANFSHIIFNLFALWIFGQMVENLWGTRRFVIYYFITGIGAALVNMMVSFNPVIGASGAVYGILLAAGMMYPDRQIMLLIPPIPIKIKYLVGIFGAMELLNGIGNPNSGVAHFAHLGGLIVGFILIKIWKIRRPNYY